MQWLLECGIVGVTGAESRNGVLDDNSLRAAGNWFEPPMPTARAPPRSTPPRPRGGSATQQLRRQENHPRDQIRQHKQTDPQHSRPRAELTPKSGDTRRRARPAGERRRRGWRAGIRCSRATDRRRASAAGPRGNWPAPPVLPGEKPTVAGIQEARCRLKASAASTNSGCASSGFSPRIRSARANNSSGLSAAFPRTAPKELHASNNGTVALCRRRTRLRVDRDGAAGRRP